MAAATFTAILAEEVDGKHQASLRRLPVSALPDEPVLIRISCSSLNYKDALALQGRDRVIRRYPMIPGIDLAGAVVESRSDAVRSGDLVVCTGCGIGEQHWGGFSQLARLKPEWLIPLPDGLTPEEAMGIGTAGFTAMLSVMALEEHHVSPDRGDVVVTGAAGGVGSMAVSLLSQNGYTVVASTGRPETHDYLRRLGASEVLDRSVLATESHRPLDTARWSGAVDTVGGSTLGTILRTTALHGCVAACGLAASATLNTTVLPFILRGVTLVGIDSNWVATDRRREAWRRLVSELPQPLLKRIMRVEPLESALALSGEILAGRIRGRVVLRVPSGNGVTGHDAEP